jgi:hypothetical protein
MSEQAIPITAAAIKAAADQKRREREFAEKLMPTHVPSKDQLSALITQILGERCPDYDVNCMTCQAWRMFDQTTAPEPEPTHFAFLIKRPRDKEAWPTIFDSREAAEGYEHRASEVVPVRLAQPPSGEQP